jgi:hypothetical protein
MRGKYRDLFVEGKLGVKGEREAEFRKPNTEYRRNSESRNPKLDTRTKQNHGCKIMQRVWGLVSLKVLAFSEFRIINFGVRDKWLVGPCAGKGLLA